MTVPKFERFVTIKSTDTLNPEIESIKKSLSENEGVRCFVYTIQILDDV